MEGVKRVESGSKSEDEEGEIALGATGEKWVGKQKPVGRLDDITGAAPREEQVSQPLEPASKTKNESFASRVTRGRTQTRRISQQQKNLFAYPSSTRSPSPKRHREEVSNRGHTMSKSATLRPDPRANKHTQ